MARRLFIPLAAALAGCSILTSPDEFTFVEANPEEACDSDSDCLPDARCPKLGNRIAGGEEKESYCYLGCSEDPGVCEETAYPYCFPDGADFAVCLAGAKLAGAFSCPGGSLESPNPGPSLILGAREPVTLSECSLRLDADAKRIAIDFAGRDPDEEGVWYEVSLVLPNRAFVPGESLDDLSGVAVKKRAQRENGVLVTNESFLAAIFPAPDLASRPPLVSSIITIEKNDLSQADGGIQGKIDCDGLVYTAETAQASD